MVLTNENIQNLQGKVLDTIEKIPENKTFSTDDGKDYYLILKKNETTQAIAVAPVIGENEVDFSQTTIVVAGTQTPGGINNHVGESFYNAGVSTVFGLTAQTKDIDDFYLETSRRIQSENGFISNMSGHSQSGPGVAKTAAKYSLRQEQPIKVTNFMDFAAKRAVQTDNFSKEEMDYLNKYATIYRDSRGDIVNYDMQGGDVPYGKTMRFEVAKDDDGHSPRTPRIKGNRLDVDWYYKRDLFASGMTEKQVRKIAKEKAKNSNINKVTANYGLESGKQDPEYYVKEYKKLYGDFAPELTKSQLIALNNQRIQEIQASMAGAGLISLREELVRATAQNAELQSQQFEEEIQKKIAEAKERLENHINEVRAAAYELAHNLSDQEIEDLLATFTMRNSWHEGLEAETLAEAEQYKRALSELSGKLNTAADRIVEADREGAGLFAAE